MSKVYGIDLGTTFSVIATLDENGNPEIIENLIDASPLLASAVYFQEDGKPVIGKEAKNQAEIEPDRVVQFVKRQIGKPDAPEWVFNGLKYNPITVSALILKRMKEYAEEQGHEVKDVVITCPAYFGMEERDATRKAGEIAGMNVLSIVNEPTAAALNYFIREYRENKKILVYDLGGGTFDVSLFDFKVDEQGNTSVDVLDSSGDDHLGGVDWDNRLINNILDQYCLETGSDRDEIDVELRQKIRTTAEETKIKLTQKDNHKISINYESERFRTEITKEHFENLTSDLVERTMDFVQQLLKENSLTPNDIDIALLVGGSTRMPMIQDAVKKLFPDKVRQENPDLVVARGAALAAIVALVEQKVTKSGNKAEDIKDLLPNAPKGITGIGDFKDILSRSFGAGVMSDRNVYTLNNLLFIGNDSPSEATKTYGTMEANQPMVEVNIFENISKDDYTTPSVTEKDIEQYTDPALKVKKIGKITLEIPPNTPRNSPIEVTFRCSTIGLEVIARNPATGQKVDTIITFENSMSQEEMENEKRKFAQIQTSGEI